MKDQNSSTTEAISLTATEQNILSRMVGGETLKSIGNSMGMTKCGISMKMKRAKDGNGLESLYQLIYLAAKNGLV